MAPLSLRLGATFAGMAPQIAAKVSHRMGSEQIAANLAAGQSKKRS